MKLSAKEVKLISGLSDRKRRRKWDAWLTFVSATGLTVATYGYGLFPSLMEWPILGFATGASVAYLVHVYFAVRPEDKLIELLRRYVDRDPEAIAQISGNLESDEVVA